MSTAQDISNFSSPEAREFFVPLNQIKSKYIYIFYDYG